MEDKAKEPDKDAMPDTLGGGIEGEADPYLDQLDSSMEDIMSEEPTRYDVPAETPAPDTAASPPEATPEPAPAPAKPSPPPVAARPDSELERARDIPVEMRVVIGNKQCTLADIIKLKKGELLDMDKGLDASVDLMVQDKIVARGELVEIDGRLGVRIIRILEDPS